MSAKVVTDPLLTDHARAVVQRRVSFSRLVRDSSLRSASSLNSVALRAEAAHDSSHRVTAPLVRPLPPMEDGLVRDLGELAVFAPRAVLEVVHELLWEYSGHQLDLQAHARYDCANRACATAEAPAAHELAALEQSVRILDRLTELAAMHSPCDP